MLAPKIIGSLVAALLQFAAAAHDAASIWAVIAAGSKGFYNYRHQADACHAYQVMLKRGVPADHIILMMQDDIARSGQNPFPGKLFNKPHNATPGSAVDVYAGCKIDYSGDIVTADLFLKVITGNASALPPGSGKVLKSGKNDRVFLNFIDHGAAGFVMFPNGPELHVQDLHAALQKMQETQMFNELLFYMEACESGSMFPNLKVDGKVLAVTASNAQESSWGTYCGEDAIVDGRNIGSCLGDLFSVAWMEDDDIGTGGETISGQIDRVTTRTDKSHVCTFGDVSFKTEPVADFKRSEVVIRDEEKALGSVDSRDIPLFTATYNYEHAKGTEAKDVAWSRLQEVKTDREADEAVFHLLATSTCKGNERTLKRWDFTKRDFEEVDCEEAIISEKRQMKDSDCHKALARAVSTTCPARGGASGGWNGYNMKYSQMLVNMCEERLVLKKEIADLEVIVRGECIAASQAALAAPDIVV